MLNLLKVSGNSLRPTYQEGDFVVVFKISCFLGTVKYGDVIVFRHPMYGLMIKRVDRVASDRKQIYVVGTHEDSVDSRQLGPISSEAVVGKVIWHIKGARR
jgi:nickel-type superoxide dismutase maturation protease